MTEFDPSRREYLPRLRRVADNIVEAKDDLVYFNINPVLNPPAQSILVLEDGEVKSFRLRLDAPNRGTLEDENKAMEFFEDFVDSFPRDDESLEFSLGDFLIPHVTPEENKRFTIGEALSIVRATKTAHKKALEGRVVEPEADRFDPLE
jgi:hypothetical protein